MRLGRFGRLAASAAAGLALVLSQTQTASADEDATASFFDDQSVVEVTTSGSDSAADLAFHHTHARQVTATNSAIAYTSCDGCRAVALSFQVVVADGNPTDLNVGNLAAAVNENCAGCESVAVAFQIVLASDQRLRLSGEGHQQLADLRRQLRRLARSDLPVDEIQNQALVLMTSVTGVLTSELHVRAKVRCDHDLEQRPAHHHGARSASEDRPDRHRD